MKKLIFALSSILLLFYLNTGMAEEEQTPLANNDKEEIYISLNPHFTTNLTGSKGTHFLQLKAQVMVIGQKTKEAVKLHMPAIRHALLMYYTSLGVNDLSTAEQKKALVEHSRMLIQKILRKYDKYAQVEGFYIMSMVVQ